MSVPSLQQMTWNTFTTNERNLLRRHEKYNVIANMLNSQNNGKLKQINEIVKGTSNDFKEKFIHELLSDNENILKKLSDKELRIGINTIDANIKMKIMEHIIKQLGGISILLQRIDITNRNKILSAANRAFAIQYAEDPDPF